MTPNMYDMAKKGLIEDLFDLIRKGEDINIPSASGYTPLHLAISKGDEKMSLMLLENNADGGVQDNNGATPLEYSAEYGLYNVAKLILNKTPNVLHIKDKHGNQPLWRALFKTKGDHDLIKLFIEHDADINHKNHLDKSPFDLAKDFNIKEIINILLKTN